ncbi:MAG: hypothetical protein ABR575_08685, partial [Actinomycetota bacterium]
AATPEKTPEPTQEEAGTETAEGGSGAAEPGTEQAAEVTDAPPPNVDPGPGDDQTENATK